MRTRCSSETCVASASTSNGSGCDRRRTGSPRTCGPPGSSPTWSPRSCGPGSRCDDRVTVRTRPLRSELVTAYGSPFTDAEGRASDGCDHYHHDVRLVPPGVPLGLAGLHRPPRSADESAQQLARQVCSRTPEPHHTTHGGRQRTWIPVHAPCPYRRDTCAIEGRRGCSAMGQPNRHRRWPEDLESFSHRVLTTLLFTDVVDSTGRVCELGDRS